MRTILFIAAMMIAPMGLAAPIYYTTKVLDDDANGIAQDQTLGGAGNLTINGALARNSLARMVEAQKVSLESSANLSGVTFTVTGTDADGDSIDETIAGPNANTVTTTNYFRTVSQIAADGAVGTNIEVGVLASNGMVTPSIDLKTKGTIGYTTLSAELSAGTGTFGMQFSVDAPRASYADSYQVDGSWRDAIDADGNGLDPDTNTATGEAALYAPVRAVRGVVTTGSTTGVYKFTIIQAE